MLVVDTGPLVAVANTRDEHHAACRRLLESHPGPLAVPAPVLVEVCQLLWARQGTASEVAFLRSVASAELMVVDLLADDYDRAAELVGQYADLPLGMVDAAVVSVAERLGAAELATLDRRHFSVVRPHHINAFALLPAQLGR